MTSVESMVEAIETTDQHQLRPDTFIPSPGYVFIKLWDKKEATKGGLHLPAKAQVEQRVATVLGVHPSDVDKCHLTEGDVIAIRASGGDIVPFDGTDRYRTITWVGDGESDIIGRWKTAD